MDMDLDLDFISYGFGFGLQLRISLNSLLVLVTTEGIFENTTNSGNNDRSRNTKTDIVGNCCMP